MTDRPSVLRSAVRRLPWWGSVILAALSYCGLKYAVPLLHFENQQLQQLVLAAPAFAPVLAIPLLLLAAQQLYANDTTKDRETYDRQEEEPKQ